MTLPAKRSKPRVRFSIFARCALITFVSSAVAAATISVLSFRATTELAYAGLRAKAEAVTKAIAAPAGGAIRFGRMEPLDEEFRRLLEMEGGEAVAAIVLDAEGRVLLEKGPGIADLGAALTARAEQALSGEAIAVSPDDTLIAVPVAFGETGTIVGAVGVAWSSDSALAFVRNSKIRTLTIAGVVLLASLAGGVFYLQRSVTRPLRDVGRAMKNVVSGRYDATIPCRDRGDEIGLMAKDLEYFRGMMEAASEATKAAMFQSAAFRSSRAAMLLADRDFNITATNSAFDQILEEQAEDFRQQMPGVDLANIVGRNIDVFHRNPTRNRKMLTAPGALPMVTDIGIGQNVHQLRVNGVRDEAGEIAGYVIEWTDVTTVRRDAAVLRGLEATQMGLRFSETWAFVEGSGQIAAAGGDVQHLAGRSARDLVEPEGLGTEELESRLAACTPSTAASASTSVPPAAARSTAASARSSTRRARPWAISSSAATSRTRTAPLPKPKRRARRFRPRRTAWWRRCAPVSRSFGRAISPSTIDTPLGADYETLREDFNAACQGLRDTVVGVSEMVDTIRTDTREITARGRAISPAGPNTRPRRSKKRPRRSPRSPRRSTPPPRAPAAPAPSWARRAATRKARAGWSRMR